MAILDAKEILDLVRDKWGLTIPQEPYSLPNGNFEAVTISPWTGTGIIDITIFHTGTQSIDLQPEETALNIQQVLTASIAKSKITEFGFYRMGTGSVKITLTFSDATTKNVTVTHHYPYGDWSHIDILTLVVNPCTGELLFPIDKSVKEIKIESTGTGTCHVDDVVLLVEGDLFLALDEYNPNNPLYQIVFINRPERTLFVSPNVIKHEQDIIIETHVKQIRHDPDNVDAKRSIFKAMKAELSRIFNTFRFDNVGSTINVSSWNDAKLPHGFGLEADPLELVTRLTLQIFYYEAVDGSLIGVRVSEVEILNDDLLGLVDAHWEDTDPWVMLQVPKGPIIEQHLLGPHVHIEISTHDFASLYDRLYATQIGSTGTYPINVDNSKSEFSKTPNSPEFTIKMIDANGDTYTYDFYNVKVKTVEMVKSTSSGMEELIWKVKLMSDYVYPSLPET